MYLMRKMNSPRISLSNRALATLLVAALVVSIGGTILGFDQLGGTAMFTGHAVADRADVPNDDAGISAAEGDSGVASNSSGQAGPMQEKRS